FNFIVAEEKTYPTFIKTMEGITIDDHTYFTLDRDWSLLSFLLYRQQCDDFLADKCSEHKRYIRNLSAIINCEDLPETAIERAGVALTSMQVKYFSFLSFVGSERVRRVIKFSDGVSSCIQSPNTPDLARECMSLVSGDSVLPKSAYVIGFVLPNTPDFVRECVSLASGSSILSKVHELFFLVESERREKKSDLINEFWEKAISVQKRKIETLSERSALVEELTTTAVYSTLQQDRQGHLVREKVARRLESMEDYRAFKRLRGQGNEDETEPRTPDTVDENSDSWAPPSPTPLQSPQLSKKSSTAQSFYPSRPRLILKSGTIIRSLLDGVPHNSFWNGNHLILDRDNGWLLNGYMEVEDFEELIEICYFHGNVELPVELKNMLKELTNTRTVRSLREMQLSMQRQLKLEDTLFYLKKWILSTVDNWLDYIELSSKNPLTKTNSESHKSASIYYSLIDRLAIQYFRTLRAGSSSESSSFVLHKVDAKLHGKQPDIYFRDDVLKIEPGNIEIAKDGIIQDTDKYDLDTNKSLRENIYEIHYAYDNLPTSKKEKIFEMDFIAFVISDNHIDSYVTRLVDHQLYISTKIYSMMYPTEFVVNELIGCMNRVLKMTLRMGQTVEVMRKAKVDDSDPLIDSPKKFKYFCDPRILPSTISETATEKSGGRKKNIKKNTK
ncbi:10882_t:CDS:2, partial [Ambispora gerdemannii]